MKSIKLQLVTLVLENGRQGIFIGVPLVAESARPGDSQVGEIWFSDVQEVPGQLTIDKLIRLLGEQACRCRATVQ